MIVDPGWRPDPFRRHELRYWDGHRWSEHVADSGAQLVDQVDFSAAWLPDPAHRHEYRLWDGSQWTEHVVDAGSVAIDPMPEAAPSSAFVVPAAPVADEVPDEPASEPPPDDVAPPAERPPASQRSHERGLPALPLLDEARSVAAVCAAMSDEGRRLDEQSDRIQMDYERTVGTQLSELEASTNSLVATARQMADSLPVLAHERNGKGVLAAARIEVRGPTQDVAGWSTQKVSDVLRTMRADQTALSTVIVKGSKAKPRAWASPDGLIVVLTVFFTGFFGLGLMIPFYERSYRKNNREAARRILQGRLDIETWATSVLTGEQAGLRRQHAERVADLKREAEDRKAQWHLDELPPLQDRARRMEEAQSELSPPWTAPFWSDWSPCSDANALAGVAIGTLQQASLDVSLPALLGPAARRSLVIKSDSAGRQAAARQIESLVLRLMVAIPPGRARFTFFDPVGHGENAAQFMLLAKDRFDASLVGGRVWTEPMHIESQLGVLAEHMETIIQQRLQRRFESIEAYNAVNVYAPEPYQVVVAFDVPQGFTETAFRRLLSIAENGPRCGVYAVIGLDVTKPAPHGVALDDLDRAADVVSWEQDRCVPSGAEWSSFVIEPEVAAPHDLANRLLETVGESSREAGRVQVPFSEIAPTNAWAGDSRAGVRAPLGPSGPHDVKHLELRRDSMAHALIAGRTGSGKSSLLHTVICGLAMNYAPSELALYLIDFKKGVEFKTYADHGLPHARVIAIAAEREFGISVLHELDRELRRRSDWFKTAPDSPQDLTAFRDKTGEAMARVVLIVDEFQEFFAEDDALAQQAGQLLDRLVRQGRSFGIHVVLASQTLSGSHALPRTVLGQIQVRIALMCSEADSRLILADDNPAARLLNRPGQAIYNDANGLIEANRSFQVAWLPDDQRDEHLRALARRDEGRSGSSTIVFDGNARADIATNASFAMAVATAPTDMPRRVSLWLGDPIGLDSPPVVSLRRQSGSNLLVVGPDATAARALLTLVMLAVSAQSPSGIVRVLDLSDVDVDVDDNAGDIFAMFPGNVSLDFTVGRRRDVESVVTEVHELMQARGDHSAGPPVILVVNGLHRARDLRDDGDSFSRFGGFGDERVASLNSRFKEVLENGPEVGVHTVVWCDSVTNLTRTLDRRSLREFTHRAAFQMPADDSMTMLDSQAAARLGPDRLLVYDEESGRLEKLRTYDMPRVEWVRATLDGMRRR